MTGKYSYEVISVNTDTKTMELRYTAEGQGPIVVGAHLPRQGETLEQIAAAFSPAHHWAQDVVGYLDVTVGATGELDLPRQPTEQELANAEMARQIAFDRTIADALVRLGVLTENPATISVTKLGGQ